MKLTFEATVRKQKGNIETGRINSVNLLSYVGKRVIVTVKEKEKDGK